MKTKKAKNQKKCFHSGTDKNSIKNKTARCVDQSTLPNRAVIGPFTWQFYKCNEINGEKRGRITKLSR